MNTDTLRKKYLDFFSSKGHRVVASASLVPRDDPTVLFTSAGMSQFKKEFLGQVGDFRRAASCQRCLRTDDLDKVGQTAYHHTFFEMLGNFSFGSYFKEEAISWAWEFLTQELRLDPQALWVSVYQDDSEAYDIWRKKVNFPAQKTVKLGAKDNFWPANAIVDGPNGPCGPCSEIFFDYGEDSGCRKEGCRPGCDCGRFVEIWNLVFTQFNRKDKGVLEPLPNKNIDTGMGLERMASVMQGVKSNFEIDIFKPITNEIISYMSSSGRIPLANTIADHIRAIVFAIYDGVIPSNEERGYVVRKLIRKAEFQGRQMFIKEPFLHKLVPLVAGTFKGVYPDLFGKAGYISKIIQEEEKSFVCAISEAPAILKREFKNTSAVEQSGKTAFKLHDTYGIPLEVTKAWAREHNFEIKEDEFNLCLKEQQARSKKSSKISGSVFAGEAVDLKVKPTRFTGYHKVELKEASILKIIKEGKGVSSVKEGDSCQMILDKTPFYAEAGGQSGDRGRIVKGKNIFEVEDTQKMGGSFLHLGKVVCGRLRTKDAVSPVVDRAWRQAASRAHSATHLLQAALRQALGSHIQQSGSLVEADRLRFDFIHPDKISDEKIKEIESLVQEKILENLEIKVSLTSPKEAQRKGALAFFNDKYGSRARLVNIGDYSRELCGGTHLDNSSAIGLFKIVSEASVAKGVRRIEALTGKAAWLDSRRQRDILEELAGLTNTSQDNIPAAIGEKYKRQEALEKECARLRIELFKQDAALLILQAEEINGVKIVSRLYPGLDMNALRGLMDMLKSRLSSYALGLAGINDSRLNLLVAISDDLVKKGLDAARIIKEAASLINASGGGRPNMAQAGGGDSSQADKALEKFKEIVRSNLSR